MRELTVVPNSNVAAYQLAFSPDGRTLAVAGAGPEPLLVDVDVERWVARACELAPSCSATPSTGEPAARE